MVPLLALLAVLLVCQSRISMQAHVCNKVYSPLCSFQHKRFLLIPFVWLKQISQFHPVKGELFNSISSSDMTACVGVGNVTVAWQCCVGTFSSQFVHWRYVCLDMALPVKAASISVIFLCCRSK